MNAPCPVCKSERFTRLYEVRDFNQGVPGEWAILQCDVCQLGRLDPFPLPEEVGSFYRDFFYTGEGQRFRGWMEGLRGILASARGWTINRLMKHRRGKLLDFGAGAGHFAAAMKRAGWDAHGIDPYSNAADGNACRIKGAGFELLYPNEHFDVVTLWYVYEHLSDPRQALAEFHRVLKKDGLLMLAQQDFESLQAKLFGPRWLYLDPPRHLWQFSPANLGRMAEEMGYEVETVKWSSLEMGPYCILQSMLNAIVGNNNDLFRFLKNRKLSQGMVAGEGPRKWPTIISIALLLILGPAALIAYFILLAFKQGDVFEIYLRRV